MREKTTSDSKMVINYINSMSNEYGDYFMQKDYREDLYWKLSSIRRHSFSFYMMDENSHILVVGDYYGTLVGSASEKAKQVDVVVPTIEYANAIKKRYYKRENLRIKSEEEEVYILEKEYSYVCAYLEDLCGYDWNNPYKFMRILNPAICHLQENGKLLLWIRGDRLYDVQRLIYNMGFTYSQYCDPLGNGAYFIEASKVNNLSQLETEYPSPMINDKWVRKHWFFGRGGEIFDQDKKLIDDVKKVEIDLLQKLVEVCEENHLSVYPVYGTLLGVVRDGGMIDGDDDIDVVMARSDYNKLLQLKEQFSGKYFLQTPYHDDCFYGGYTKLRNIDTTAIHPQNEWTDACEGISIDIFPMDSSYTNPKKEMRKRRKIHHLQRLLFAKSYGYFKEFRDMPMLKWKFYKYLGKLLDRDKLIDKLYCIMQSGDENTDQGAIYCHYGHDAAAAARYIDRKAYQDTISLNYEGVTLQVPTDWHNLLCSFYGDGYGNRMDFNEGKRRHGFYDVNVPYTIYKKRFSGLHYPTTIKEPIVLFGDGSIFNACLSYYKDKVNIAHLVQLPEEEVRKPVMGIPVETWEEFEEKGLNKTSYRAIICSGDVRYAEKILSKAGYEDYYIFWYNRDWMLYANQTQIWREIQNIDK